jgi:predicted ArsR family transcriptional regulator
MPRPNALKRLRNVDAVIQQAPAPTHKAAADALGVDVSTVRRHLKRSVSQQPARTRPRPPGRRRRRSMTARGWGAWVRRTYELTATEDGFVSLAVKMRLVAEDEQQPARLRVAASREYRALVAELKLEDPDDGEAEDTEPEDAPRWPRAIE